MKYVLVFALSLILFNCEEKQRESLNADAIIDASISASGVKKLNNSVLSFDFRDTHYEAARYAGSYVMKRKFKDSTSTIVDYLSNKNFERRIDDSLVTVVDSMASLYGASINSVHYFAVLPYGLDGKAVKKTYLDSIKLKDHWYHKIEVTFAEEGGGEDFEDVFIYWVDTKTFKIDYLAYSYTEDDGQGLRFREGYNERYINGIRFLDYKNYRPVKGKVKLEDLDLEFINSKLELLSKIELENIRVN